MHSTKDVAAGETRVDLSSSDDHATFEIVMRAILGVPGWHARSNGTKFTMSSINIDTKYGVPSAPSAFWNLVNHAAFNDGRRGFGRCRIA